MLGPTSGPDRHRHQQGTRREARTCRLRQGRRLLLLMRCTWRYTPRIAPMALLLGGPVLPQTRYLTGAPCDSGSLANGERWIGFV